jgi:hypothetical protein
VTLLLLAGALQRPLNRGHGLWSMNQCDRTQGEPIRQKGGEEVGALLPILLHGRDEAGRHPRLALGLRQEHEVVTLEQLHLEGQGVGHAIQGAFVRSNSHAAKHRGWTWYASVPDSVPS